MTAWADKEATRKRLYKLVDQAVDRYDEEDAEKHFPQSTIDDAALVFMVTYTDPDNDRDCEKIQSFFTTKRRYVQFGLIASAHERCKEYV